jgi:hypothetical protein
MTNDENPQQSERIAYVLANFPYERVVVPGTEALSTWQKLKDERAGVPVVVGCDKDAALLVEPFDFSAGKAIPRRSPLDILEAANRLAWPEDIRRRKHEMYEYYRRRRVERIMDNRFMEGPVGDQIRSLVPAGASDAEARAWLLQQIDDEHKRDPPTGSWPEEGPPDAPAASCIRATREGVSIAIVPAREAAELPAYFCTGGWNAYPPPEDQVAALRSWAGRYGAEIVGMERDTLDIRVARCPQTREEAFALAREHYDFCPDCIWQGADTLAGRAARLMVGRWWHFWWD